MKSSFREPVTKEVLKQGLFFTLCFYLLGSSICAGIAKSPANSFSEKTNEELIAQYESKINNLRTSLKDIYKLVNEEKLQDNKEPIKNLDPLPFMDNDMNAGTNTEIIMSQKLSEPDKYINMFPEKSLAPDFSSGWPICAEIMTAYQELHSAKSKKSNKPARKSFENSLQKSFPTYLAVIKINSCQPPQLTQDSKSRPGSVSYQVCFVDFKNKKILGSISGETGNSDEVLASINSNENPQQSESLLIGDFNNNCTSTIAKKVAWLTGARIK